ncbi:cytochrome b/b6 domain-containing protein [Isoptericola sp. NPDC019693]|uniref:cytochrome b/b6 domain-containing protein n=1 Tax=Isoptericola sp. NPDC019693 TaxID=3364009 RepID=UPI0037A81A5C
MTRQGLPRRPGGPPWPPVDAARTDAAAPAPGAASVAGSTSTRTADDAAPAGVRRGLPRVPASAAGGVPAAGAGHGPGSDVATGPDTAGGPPLRRGLPRVAGAEPWPPAGTAPAGHGPAVLAVDAGPAVVDQIGAGPAAVDEGSVTGSGSPLSDVVEGAGRSGTTTPGVDRPTVSPPDTGPTSTPTSTPPAAPAPRPRRLPAWAARAAVLAAGAVVVLGLLVLVARWWVGTGTGQQFLAAYPGTAPMPSDAPVGIPAWLAWQHFFNVFLLVLAVRTGLQVRLQRRPAASWAPRANPGARIGLMAWAHQALDVLWVVNGLAYVVLLFATGQWMRIVPTSWTVVPEALSAGIQYLTLQWPTEDGWVHYNGLQQLAYFATVFVAAPLAILSGLRMSVYWRSRPVADRLVPIGLARRVHFPVMLYFVAFVVLHVGLVLATGARRNLEHMFAASDDGTWIGVVLFGVSVVVIAGAAAALRPVVVAPVARRFGTVSSR